MQFKVVIPSYKRWNVAPLCPLLPHSVLVIPASQRPMYDESFERHGVKPMEVVEHPDIVGVPPTRNWILDTLFEPRDDAIVMVDDDLNQVFAMMSFRMRISPDPLYMIEIFRNTGQLALDMRIGQWGYAHTPRPLERSGFKPFALRHWVSGHAVGTLDRELRYDVETINEDPDISLQHIAKHRMLLMDLRYCFDHLQRVSGGATESRTSENRMRSLKRLQAKWGPGIVGFAPNKRDSGMSLHITTG